MNTAHLAAGSWPWQVFHIGTSIDGAIGFVFLSGPVLVITQRRAIKRGEVWMGESAARRRRAALVAQRSPTRAGMVGPRGWMIMRSSV